MLDPRPATLNISVAAHLIGASRRHMRALAVAGVVAAARTDTGRYRPVLSSLEAHAGRVFSDADVLAAMARVSA